MSKFELVMPKMGESVQEATITKWFKKVGDSVEEDDPILEIATDKVDSEIPSPVDGKIIKVFYKENDLVPVGKVIAVISLDGSDEAIEEPLEHAAEKPGQTKTEAANQETKSPDISSTGKFLSPLVKSIANQEKIGAQELDQIKGTGRDGRIKKEDILAYVQQRGEAPQSPSTSRQPASMPKTNVPVYPGDEVVEMDRMRKLIAQYMVASVQTSPHVTNFIEADVTNIVRWRETNKNEFEKREGVKLTYMPVFTEAIARALRDFKGVNVSIDGNNIIYRKNINIGMAVALPNGNLIVPVVKNADQKTLLGLTLELNKLADNARKNKLSPDDVKGGTFSISNFGTFKNLTGTPIINQPEVAIIATGTIEKKPAVLETPGGDVIAIRHKMILSMSYDHRVIDGALGGAFLKRVSEYLEQFDINRKI